MAIKVSFISGKGGSGKTTVSLALAKMLSSCNINVLLIDCDIATNGATYFFESKLTNANSIYSLSDMFDENERSNIITPLHINPIDVEKNFRFIPATISYSKTVNISQIVKGKSRFDEQLSQFDKKYDVILFDCQAGFSEFIKIIVAHSDYNVLVVEPDAISSSATRVLFTRLANAISKKRNFQIFNKVTKEEKDVYEKITSGTMFDSLPPVSFNWEVRKAFAFNFIPDMVSTNTVFGYDVYNLATSMFPSLRAKLNKYTDKLLQNEKNEFDLNLKKLMNEKPITTLRVRSSRRRFLFVYVVFPLFTFLSTIALFINIIFSPDTMTQSKELSISLVSLTLVGFLLTLVIFSPFNKIADEYHKQTNAYADYNSEIDRHKHRIFEIESKLKLPHK